MASLPLSLVRVATRSILALVLPEVSGERVLVESSASNPATMIQYTANHASHVVIDAPEDECLSCGARATTLNESTGACDNNDGWCTVCTATTDCD